MNEYDFSTLNDKEFEKITLDLLNKKLGLTFQSFKKGKDKGIDLRYSSNTNNNKIIVQAKHYVGSSFAQLKHTLKNKEFEKVKKLQPLRYIVVTSLPLSAQEKDEIKLLIQPYIKTANDIYGKDDLNDLLRRFPEVEKAILSYGFQAFQF
ncbi:restriction endonuclease [Persicobacter diffluens]|uniref:Restriction endonuclease type IV Mrr domain-containing protein n=1 Tax=Persicobacter diffluens TaxID=981 RepID=A0AAN5ANU3_9BACT|nr:hypothetical protein PEDI_57090 [Persicobacter diffluens]